MKFNKTILKNGLRVITVPMKDNPTATVLVLVEAGSKYETKKENGISHFLEHMCFKGTDNRPTALSISHELDALGSESNAFTSQEFTGYYAKSDARHVFKILDIIADIYLHPVIKKEELEKEKGVIIDEMNMYEDMPNRTVGELAMELLYGDQPAGWRIIGTKEKINAVTPEEMRSYRTRLYVPAATTVVVTGNIKEREILSQIKKYFDKMPAHTPVRKLKVSESQKQPQARVKYKKTDQAHLVVAFRTFDLFNKENPVLSVLSGILGAGMSSRLFQKIRDEMGVGYYVRAGNDAYTDHGFLEISAGVDPKRIKEVLNAVLAECRRLMKEKVTPSELEKVKEYLVGTMHLGLEGSDSIAQFYGMQEILGKKKIEDPETIAKKIRAVTAQDVMNIAKKIFVNKGLNLAIIGPFKDEKPFMGDLHI